MEGAGKSPDKLNNVAIIAAGAVGAILVYVSIVLLQAFYMNDTSEVEQHQNNAMADLEWQTLKAAQSASLGAYAPARGDGKRRRVPIDRAMELVLAQVAKDPLTPVPAVGASNKASLLPDGKTPVTAAAPAAPAEGAATPGATPAPAGAAAAPAAGTVPPPAPAAGTPPGAPAAAAPGSNAP